MLRKRTRAIVLTGLLMAAVWPANVSFAQPGDVASELALNLQTLLPRMGAEKIADSKQAQLDWENICREMCRPGREADQLAASKLMASKLGPEVADGARICLLRQLEYVGGAEAVDAIAKAMDDDSLLVRKAARRALTLNPAPAATGKLLAKLESEKDDAFKIGLLMALGQREDASSTDAVGKLLRDENEQVIVAAARALGEIATPLAAELLKSRRQDAEGDLRLRLGNESLRCANKLLDKGKIHKATEVFGDLTGDGEPESVRMSAVSGQIAAAGDWQMVVFIANFLRGDDLAKARVAASHVAELDSVRAKRLAEILPKLPAASQELLLQALALRADKSAMPQAVAATKNADEEVRLAALRSLATLGDASTVPLLLKALSEGGAVASAARHALEAVYGEGTEEKIIAAMQAAKEVQPRALMIEILHRRQSVAAVAALLKETGHESVKIRRRAMSALSQLAEISDVAEMLSGVLSAEAGAERDDAEKAVMLLCNRVPEKDERAKPVLAVFENASAEEQLIFLPLLGRIGGAGSFVKVEAALGNEDKKTYDVGVRALCNWPDGDVAPRLLEISQSSEDESHQLRAMRAFIRVIALRNERPNEESLALLKKAMAMAERDEERNLILSRTVSAEIRGMEALRFVLPYVNNPATAQMACRAIVALSHHRYLRRPNQEEFNKALSEVIRVSDDVGLRDQARRYRSDL